MKNMYNEYPERIYIDRGIDAGTAALLKDNSANEMLPWMTMMNNGGMGFVFVALPPVLFSVFSFCFKANCCCC